MTMLTVLIVGLGLALTALAILVYAMVRLSGWSPDDGAPVASARMHGFAMAMIATLAVLCAGFLLQGLAEDGFSDAHQEIGGGTQQGAEAIEFPASPLDPVSAVLTAALPALLLLGIYALAQRTWPRKTGPVRKARLVARRTMDYVPRPVLWFAVGLGIIALAAVVLSWSTPGVGALHLSYATQNHTLGTYRQGSRPGTEFAPYLVLALILLAAATALAIVLVARRPPLAGLPPLADDALRRVSVHRVLRTTAAAALVVSVVAVASWANGVRASVQRAAAGDLEDLADQYAAGITLTPEGPVHTLTAPDLPLPLAVDVLMYVAPIAALLGLAVLLLWRPAAANSMRADSA